jgi:predicted acylesterase/phospholipase RssA
MVYPRAGGGTGSVEESPVAIEVITSAAKAYLAGRQLTFDEVCALWRSLKSADDLSLARRVLERLRQKKGLIGNTPADLKTRRRLCHEHALLTSKDRELSATLRHDLALEILTDFFGDLDDPQLDGDAETLGIAGGILKRRWNDLGRMEDLRRAARCYDRGAGNDVGDDAYAHINAAFVTDLLAHAGDEPTTRHARARALRELILERLPAVAAVPPGSVWFNTATRAEALFGLRRYADATRVVAECPVKPAPWELETTARQMATLAYLHEPHPLDVPDIRAFFDVLLSGAADAARSIVIGKVGLALSGGGFRASFYHLGVLARLAELNVLRHVDVLSCVSGGSIVGACYWLVLRNRMLQPGTLSHQDYISIVQEVMTRFLLGVEGDVRGAVQPSRLHVLRRLLVQDERGALDPEATASALEELFYAPLMKDASGRCMHDLPFTPADHNVAASNSASFHPGKHNWLRANKVPALVLNATTVNTGHAWQFTPTWMGESPWAIHEAADSIPRLEWSWYNAAAGWTMEVARAVAASACVPGVFAPMTVDNAYEGVQVQLVDGGVHDNQGTVSLLALDCNVVLVSDACGQLLLEKETSAGLSGLLGYANRSMSTLMERVRLANFADLTARTRSGLLRGLMFLHMKAGLDADTIRLKFSQESYEIRRDQLSPAGVRKDFQQALAELRTDLNVFTPDESDALMACGYQMACWAFQRDLAHLKELADEPVDVAWRFKPMLAEITSLEASTPRRDSLLKAFREGSRVRL